MFHRGMCGSIVHGRYAHLLLALDVEQADLGGHVRLQYQREDATLGLPRPAPTSTRPALWDLLHGTFFTGKSICLF